MKKSVLNGLLALGALAGVLAMPAMAQTPAPKMGKMAPKMGKMAPKMGKMAPKMSSKKMPMKTGSKMKVMGTAMMDGKKVTCLEVNGKMMCKAGDGKMMACKMVNGKMMCMKGGKMMPMMMDKMSKGKMSHTKMSGSKMSHTKMSGKM